MFVLLFSPTATILFLFCLSNVLFLCICTVFLLYLCFCAGFIIGTFSLHVNKYLLKLIKLLLDYYYYLWRRRVASRYSDYATGWTIRGSNPGNGKTVFSKKRPERLWNPPSLLLNGYRGHFQRAKQAGREVKPLTAM